MREGYLFKIFNRINYNLVQYRLKMKWRQQNRHNSTGIGTVFDISCLSVGKGTYGVINVLADNSGYKINIKNFCSIASGVIFILCSDHRMDTISTFPFQVKYIYTEKQEAISKGNITVEDDVWIGAHAVILSGITIHQGAVIAAGSVVTKDVPPYAVVGGVPARVIKYRFQDDIVRELMKIDYSRFTKDLVERYTNELYAKIDSADQVQKMEWLPRK